MKDEVDKTLFVVKKQYIKLQASIKQIELETCVRFVNNIDSHLTALMIVQDL